MNPMTGGPKATLHVADSLGSREATERLIDRIVDYWQSRGKQVNAHIAREGAWVIRSDMINGWPTERIIRL